MGEDALGRECRRLTRYLTGQEPDPRVLQHYRRFHELGRPGFVPAGVDRMLLGSARLGGFPAALADSYAARFRKRSPLRRKLVLLLALLESVPSTAQWMDTPGFGGPVLAILKVAVAGALEGLRVLLGLVVFGPVHALTALFGGGRRAT